MDESEEAAHKRHMERLRNMTGGGVDALWSLGSSNSSNSTSTRRSPRSLADSSSNSNSPRSNNDNKEEDEASEEERRYLERVREHERLKEAMPNLHDPFGIGQSMGKRKPDARSSIANSFSDPTLSDGAKRGADAYRKVALSINGGGDSPGESSLSGPSTSPASANVPGISNDDETAFRAQQERLKALAAASSRTAANPNQLREKMMRESVKAPPGMENFHKEKDMQERMTRMAMADLAAAKTVVNDEAALEELKPRIIQANEAKFGGASSSSLSSSSVPPPTSGIPPPPGMPRPPSMLFVAPPPGLTMPGETTVPKSRPSLLPPNPPPAPPAFIPEEDRKRIEEERKQAEIRWLKAKIAEEEEKLRVAAAEAEKRKRQEEEEAREKSKRTSVTKDKRESVASVATAKGQRGSLASVRSTKTTGTARDAPVANEEEIPSGGGEEARPELDATVEEEEDVDEDDAGSMQEEDEEEEYVTVADIPLSLEIARLVTWRSPLRTLGWVAFLTLLLVPPLAFPRRSPSLPLLFGLLTSLRLLIHRVSHAIGRGEPDEQIGSLFVLGQGVVSLPVAAFSTVFQDGNDTTRLGAAFGLVVLGLFASLASVALVLCVLLLLASLALKVGRRAIGEERTEQYLGKAIGSGGAEKIMRLSEV